MQYCSMIAHLLTCTDLEWHGNPFFHSVLECYDISFQVYMACHTFQENSEKDFFASRTWSSMAENMHLDPSKMICKYFYIVS